MTQAIVHTALVVSDYDEAIAYFTKVLGFTVVEDRPVPEEGKRWVVVAPPGWMGTSLVLGRASNEAQNAFIGNQTGGRVTFFLRTDDFWRDYETYRARGVEFVRPPATLSYGTVAVFKDFYGNLWDLVEYGHPARVRMQSAVPAFLVSDVDATARWYGEALGFNTAGIFPPQPPAAWASLQRDGAEIMLQRLPGYRKPDLYDQRPGGVWNAYLRITGVRPFYETVRDQPFIKTPLCRQPYGDWEFEVVDPNGYVLVFGGDDWVK